MILPRRAWLAAPLLLLGCTPQVQSDLVKTAKRFSKNVNDFVQRFPLIPADIKAQIGAINARIQEVPDGSVLLVLQIHLEALIPIAKIAAQFIPEPFKTAVLTVLGFLGGLIGGTPAAGTAFAPSYAGLAPASREDAEKAAAVLVEAK